MNRRPSRQQGMTAIGFLLMFILIGFFSLLTLKLFPIYMDHFKILSTLEALKHESGIAEKSPHEIMNMLQKRWDINYIDRIKADKSVFFERHPGYMKIQVAYEVEEPVLGNVSVLVKFDNSIDVSTSN